MPEELIYQRLFENNPSALFMLDGKGEFVTVNRRFTEIAGFTTEELSGRCIEDFLAGSRRQQLAYHQARIHHRNRPFEQEICLKAKNRREIVVNIRSNINTNERFTVGSIEDITERKALESQVQRYTERLEEEVRDRTQELEASLHELKGTQEQLIQAEKLSALGVLVAGVAHELNNPLTGVVGFSELLVLQEAPGKKREFLENIHREALRMRTIVQNLLLFARHHAPKREPADLNQILEQILNFLAYQHRVSNIQVTRTMDPDLPQVLVDANQLHQVFFNLFTNACQAMPRGGTLTVRTSRAEVDGRPMVQGEVQDTGSGIPEALLPRIFDPFFTTKEVGQGTGLGLSLCYGIVKEHGGDIRVESEEGRGSRFTVLVPLAEE